MNQYVPSEQLWTEFDGALEFEYEHSVYWPALHKMAEERREARKARWIAGGKHIGELEDYLSGFVKEGIAPSAKVEPEPEPAAQSATVGAPATSEEQKEEGEAPKMDVVKPEESKAEGSKVEDSKLEETKVEETKVEETKVEDLKVEDLKV